MQQTKFNEAIKEVNNRQLDQFAFIHATPRHPRDVYAAIDNIQRRIERSVIIIIIPMTMFIVLSS